MHYHPLLVTYMQSIKRIHQRLQEVFISQYMHYHPLLVTYMQSIERIHQRLQEESINKVCTTIHSL